jgi:hypothetical protein
MLFASVVTRRHNMHRVVMSTPHRLSLHNVQQIVFIKSKNFVKTKKGKGRTLQGQTEEICCIYMYIHILYIVLETEIYKCWCTSQKRSKDIPSGKWKKIHAYFTYIDKYRQEIQEKKFRYGIRHIPYPFRALCIH